MAHPVLKGTEEFLDRIFAGLTEAKIDVSTFFCDHICWRVETPEEYEAEKVKFGAISMLLVENEVRGRYIATYKLNDPIKYKGREIPLVELPSPKKGSPYPSGWEHVEMVITDSFEEFVAKHPHLKFDMSASKLPFNPEMRYAIEGGKVNVKFHHMPLEKVIEIEKIQESKHQ
jgi:predicted metalloenzyme YecM